VMDFGLIEEDTPTRDPYLTLKLALPKCPPHNATLA
jgi:hypothetical protein